MTLPFDPADVARRIAAGDVVHLGKNIVLFRRLSHLVRQCRRCILEETQTFTLATLIDETERLTQFIFKHQHKEPAS